VVCHGPRPVGCWPIQRTRSLGVSSESINVQSGQYCEHSWLSRIRARFSARERCRQIGSAHVGRPAEDRAVLAIGSQSSCSDRRTHNPVWPAACGS
jgi:hypothetical protein